MISGNNSRTMLTSWGRLNAPAVIIPALAMLVSLLVYFLTCQRSFTWWKNVEYLLIANDLGVAHPPGSLLTTLLGGLVATACKGEHLALILNFFSSVLAALTVLGLVVLTAGLRRKVEDDPVAVRSSRTFVLAGSAAGALTLAFSPAFWMYAVQFTPYMLTVVMTVLIVAALLAWWRRAGDSDSYLLILLIAFLFGLDFSVHRTNLLMLPGFLLIILLRRPRILIRPRSWFSLAAGLGLGLSIHFLLIPMSAADPFLNSNQPNSLSRFWDYVSLRQFGGGFLVQFLPRKASFFGVQMADYTREFARNFFGGHGLLSFLPGLFGLGGWVALWRQNRGLASVLLILFLCTSLGAVIYFNVPENYFRTMERHYLPSFFIFAIWVAYGIASLLSAVAKGLGRRIWAAGLAAGILLLLLPGYQLLANYREQDASRHYFARDYALNFMATLPDNAIVFCYGDNDTHPLWYLQAVEGRRRDVMVLNMPLLNTDWYVRQTLARHPDLPLPPEISDMPVTFRPWKDSTVVIAGAEQGIFEFPDSVAVPDSIFLTVGPDVADRILLPQHWIMLEIIKTNRWRRPIYFSCSGQGAFPAWLEGYLRPEGLAFRLVPLHGAAPDWNVLEENVMRKYVYRGYADSHVTLDGVSRGMGINYLAGMIYLLNQAMFSGQAEKADQIVEFVRDYLPPERLRPLPPGLEEAVNHFLEN